ncbi:MAG: hypothetical protein EXR75_01625 [Myxococcales bacterium]|nr:hypothetical protein [Myxococcales bacterium]
MLLFPRLLTRLVVLTPLAAYVGAAGCYEESVPPADDGVILTGAGGAVAATGASSTAAGTTASQSATGTGTGTGATTSTSASSASNGSVGSGPACNDSGVGEPNQNEGTAHVLVTPTLSDCDGDAGKVIGRLKKGDIDWFTYTGDDTFSCSVDPSRTLSPEGEGVRLCKYIECLTGETTFTCPAGTTADTSAEKRAGCCGPAGFVIGDINCAGSLDEQTYVYLRVDLPGADEASCLDYTLTYHY